MTKRMLGSVYSDKRDRIDSSSPQTRQMSNAFLLQKMSGEAMNTSDLSGINSSILPLVKELSSQIEAAEKGDFETSKNSNGEMLEAAAAQEKQTKSPAGPSGTAQGSSESVSSSVDIETSAETSASNQSSPSSPNVATTSNSNASEISGPQGPGVETPNTSPQQVSTPQAAKDDPPPEICSVYTANTQVMFDEEVVDVYFNARDKYWDPLTWDYNWSGALSGQGEENNPTSWIKLSFNIAEHNLEAGQKFTVQASVFDPAGQSDTESIDIEIIGRQIQTWEVLYDNEDAQSAQRVDLIGDRTRREEEEEREAEEERQRQEEERRQRSSDPLVFDLDENGGLDTATGSHLADGNIDGDTVLFDIDPSRASWSFVSSTDVPGLDAPSIPGGYVVYENGDRENIGQNGVWNAQTEGNNFVHARAKVYNQSNEWVGEWVRLTDTTYDYFWGGKEERERTEWLKKGTGDGFLVWDHNGNGTIDDNTEMMSEFDQEGHEVFANGYEKLRHYFDKDGDGVIKGSEMQGLMFWVDSDANAQTDAGELKTLDEYGITEIVIPTEGQLTSEATIGKQPTKP